MITVRITYLYQRMENYIYYNLYAQFVILIFLKLYLEKIIDLLFIIYVLNVGMKALRINQGKDFVLTV
jgi:hypothetical protein